MPTDDRSRTLSTYDRSRSMPTHERSRSMPTRDRTSSPLFDPYELGPLTLKNRAVMSPMTRSRALGNVPNALMAEYYAQRSGAGLIVTEGTAPSPSALGYPRIPGIFDDEQVRGWKLVTDAVHAASGRIFIQLMHTGRVSHPGNLPRGARVLAPSPVPLDKTQMWVDDEGMLDIPVAEEMTGTDIREAIGEFVDGSHRAIDAGFDGVELHGANGYLIEQFIHPHTNRRSDEWGGSVQGRVRFALEVAEAVADEIGGQRLGIRISPYGVFNEMPLYDEIDETYDALTAALSELGLVYVHVVDHSDQGAPDVPESLKARLRETFAGSVIRAGGYDFERASDDLLAGRCDLVAFGRPFLANPDLLERYRTGTELNEPRSDLFYGPGEEGFHEGYTDYPTR